MKRALIILAAGRSARMGEPKALLRLPDGREWIAEQIERARTAVDFSGGIRVVANPADGAGVSASVGKSCAGVSVVLNEQPSPSGAFDSLLLGFGDNDEEVWVLPVDCPFPSPKTAARLLDVPMWSPHRAVVPEFEGRTGHPVVIRGQSAIADLRRPAPELRLDRVLDRWKREEPGSVVRVAVGDASVRWNLNTPEDWARYMNASRSRSSSSQIIASPSLPSSFPTGGSP